MNRLSVPGSYVKSMPYKQRQPVVIEADETPAAPLLLPTIEVDERAYDEERILPYTAGDLVACLTHTATAAFAPQGLGGCKDPVLRQANKDLVEAFLRGLEGQQWELTLHLLRDLQQDGLELHLAIVITYSALISACE